MKTVMSEMKSRNLNPKIFVIDGSRALKSAMDKHYPWVAVESLTKSTKQYFERKMNALKNSKES